MNSPNPARLNPNDPNVAMLEVVAARLGPDLCRELVFVGGAVAGLLITDTAQPAIRPTEDVDLLAQVLARLDYYALEDALRARGFARDMRQGAPICRWVVDRVIVVGICFGIYSSVLVASPLVMWLGVSREQFMQR